MNKLKYLLLLLLFARLLDLQSQVEEEGEIAKRDDDRQGSIPYRSCTCRMHALTNPRLTFPHLPHTPSFGSNLSFFFIAFYHQQLKEEDTFSISSSAFPIALLSFVRSFVRRQSICPARSDIAAAAAAAAAAASAAQLGEESICDARTAMHRTTRTTARRKRRGHAF